MGSSSGGSFASAYAAAQLLLCACYVDLILLAVHVPHTKGTAFSHARFCSLSREIYHQPVHLPAQVGRRAE